MYTKTFQITAILATVFATTVLSATCSEGFTLCSPPGATSTNTPQIGTPNFLHLFIDIIQSSLPPSKRYIPQSSSSLCCNTALSCLTLSTLSLPFCYDRFTTNYLLPDSSTGSIVSGSYKSAVGDIANLISGDYTLANGTTGNIYAASTSLKPDTATLPMPTQFTATGVGSAIPIASLGTYIVLTYTTTIPGSTFSATTLPPVTLQDSSQTVTVLLPSTATVTIGGGETTEVVGITSYSIESDPPSVIEGYTRAGSTAPAITSVVTTTMFSALSATSSPSTTKKSGGDVMAGSVMGVWIGMMVQLLLSC